MHILRIFVVTVACAACAVSAQAAGFGCGMTPYEPGCHCNYADALWAGYQPTQPIYTPSYGCGCGGLGWHHFGSACGGNCWGGGLGWRGGGLFGRGHASLGSGFDGCCTSFPHTGFDVTAGCTGGACGTEGPAIEGHNTEGHGVHPAPVPQGNLEGAAPEELPSNEVSPSDTESVPEPPPIIESGASRGSVQGPFAPTRPAQTVSDDDSDLLPPSGQAF